MRSYAGTVSRVCSASAPSAADRDPAAVGAQLLANGDDRAAITPLLRAVTLQPDDAWSHYRLGLAYAHVGWHRAALQQFRTAARLAPESAEFHAALGCGYRETGDLPIAVTELEQATRLAPDEARHRYRLAGVLLELDRRGEAMKQLKAARERAPAAPTPRDMDPCTLPAASSAIAPTR
jgi:Flp pilus assembly protein TadD